MFLRLDNLFSRFEKAKEKRECNRKRDVRDLSHFQNLTKSDKVAVNGGCVPKKDTLKVIILLLLCIN